MLNFLRNFQMGNKFILTKLWRSFCVPYISIPLFIHSAQKYETTNGNAAILVGSEVKKKKQAYSSTGRRSKQLLVLAVCLIALLLIRMS